MPKEFIVAIELGSSQITAIAGQKIKDGGLKVLAVATENAAACIRHGVVYNIDKTAQALVSVKKQLRTKLGQDIKQAYVCVGGRSIRSVRNMEGIDLANNQLVEKQMVYDLMDRNRAVVYPDQEVLDAVSLEYKVDKQMVSDPVGVTCSRLEGNYINILWRKSFFNNFRKCFENAEIGIAEMYIAPLAMADSVLTDTERRTGCVLIDLGADTTTIAAYYRDTLRHLAVVPLGSNHITRDIASLHMEESEAERMKLKYGCAYTENADIDDTLSYTIDGDRKVESRKFIDIVESRLEEILANVWNQVPPEIIEKMLGGIILTGGGSNMAGIEQAVRRHTGIDKVRVAKFVTQNVTFPDKVDRHNGRFCTVLGLLAKGEIDCAGPEIGKDLFEQAPPDTVPLGGQAASTSTGSGGGVVTGPNKTAAEEEAAAAKAAEEAARKKREEEEARQHEEEERRRRENSFFGRISRKLKQFGNDMVSPDDQ